MRPLLAVVRLTALILCAFTGALTAAGDKTTPDPLTWPKPAREARPWTYWWWMGSAVDKENLSRELRQFRDAGFGGVHIIPIYGARGYEERFIPYLSSRWMEMLEHVVMEAERLDLGVDMTTGSGWCFGGPIVTEALGTAQVVAKPYYLLSGSTFNERIEPKGLQALVAFGPDGTSLDLLPKLNPGGTLNHSFGTGPWRIYAVSQRSSRQKVKRAAPGGEGLMLNPLSASSMAPYLGWFDDAFSGYRGGKPRAMYHDSYEYSSTWAPDFFGSFEAFRGYRLQDELPFLFYDPAKDPPRDLDRVARVKSDYRETISDVITDKYTAPWVQWSHAKGFVVRNEAHGSPANWLDLYALADIPETEMFHQDRNKLISKFASSAAHVLGKPLVSSETCTWLKEHFTETLADAKYLLDDLFLSGVNHIFYHGSCYSPADAPWPGWLFYASLQMNSRNSIWRDAPVLNAYAARCQSVLQSGAADNDLLLYWPIHDTWHSATGMVQTFNVHSRGWFETQPIGRTAEHLFQRGYQFDFISDRLLAQARSDQGRAILPGGEYRAIVIPPVTRMPVQTFRRLLDLAGAGATVIFQNQLPTDVPGLAGFPERRAEMKRLTSQLQFRSTAAGLSQAQWGRGLVLCGALDWAMETVRLPREELFSRAGVMCVRRRLPEGYFYFIANRAANASLKGWVPLARPAEAVVLLDPMSGGTGIGRVKRGASGCEVYLHLPPGESIIVRCLDKRVKGQNWAYIEPAGTPIGLGGTWQIDFVEGGPELPPRITTAQLGSWAALPDARAERFAGTARYSLKFAPPAGSSGPWILDLGSVAQSARVRLNGESLGTLLTPPFRVVAESLARENLLEVEVTSTSANRIRDLDRRGATWKNFYDINFVGIDYKPFNAAAWPLADCGLLGPVTLTRAVRAPTQ